MPTPQTGGVFNPYQDVTVTGNLLSGGGPTVAALGYATGTGAGSSVTQLTNRTTAVTVNGLCGNITTNNASLAAEVAAAFVVNNASVGANDYIGLHQVSGAVGLMTQCSVSAVAAGTFTVNVMNNNAAAGIAETGAIVLRFMVFKGSTT